MDQEGFEGFKFFSKNFFKTQKCYYIILRALTLRTIILELRNMRNEQFSAVDSINTKIGRSCHMSVKITKKCGALTLQGNGDLKLGMSQVKHFDYWKNSRFQVARQNFGVHHQIEPSFQDFHSRKMRFLMNFSKNKKNT